MRLTFADIEKAHFDANPRMDLFVNFPKGLGLPSNLVVRHAKCVYGPRDAGPQWEDAYRLCLESMGFKSGIASHAASFIPSVTCRVLCTGMTLPASAPTPTSTGMKRNFLNDLRSG